MEPFARIGNNLSADFVNTIVSFDHDGGTLRSAGDVVDFLAATGASTTAEAERVRAQVADDVAGERFLSQRRSELRAAVRAALTAIEDHEPLGEDALALINAILAGDARLRATRAAQWNLRDRTETHARRSGDRARSDRA